MDNGYFRLGSRMSERSIDAVKSDAPRCFEISWQVTKKFWSSAVLTGNPTHKIRSGADKVSGWDFLEVIAVIKDGSLKK